MVSGKDSVSQAYPNLGDGGSSVYQASLTPSALKMLGIKKRKMFGDESSIGQGTVFEDEQEEEIDPQEENRRKQQEFIEKYHRKRNETVIGKLKNQVSQGVLTEAEFAKKVG